MEKEEYIKKAKKKHGDKFNYDNLPSKVKRKYLNIIRHL